MSVLRRIEEGRHLCRYGGSRNFRIGFGHVGYVPDSEVCFVTYSINGTLNGEQLDLDGDCNGDGDINLPLFNINGTFALDGTIGGSLNKMN